MKNINTTIVNEIQIKNPQADVIISLEESINSSIQNISKATAERKKLNEMIESALMNDSTYRDHKNAATKAVNIKNGTKKQILRLPSNKNIVEKVSDLNQQLKEEKSALSDYLLEYQRLAGATQLDLFDGQTVDIVKTAKVIKPFRHKR